MFEELAQLIPVQLLERSGSVFYSGRSAFSGPAPLYLLGLNPGGSAEAQKEDTVAKHLQGALSRPEDQYSEYLHGEWYGKPGTWGMQPRVRHLCDRLGLDACDIPASNLIFARSARERDLRSEKQALIDLCWPFHQAVIDMLRPKIIICFGQTAGNEVLSRLGGGEQVDCFKESNGRKWVSRLHQTQFGPLVATLTHPSIAAWNITATDPSAMVKRWL